jgi:thiosulfate/3-mercaptopyruvate sulfurtransferase
MSELWSDFAYPESLASTQWLAGCLGDPITRIVEIVWGDESDEWGMSAYRAGHIPGAVAWDFAAEMQDPARQDIVDRAGFEALLSRSGITPATTVVLYSGLSNLLATFAFWLLKVYGHPNARLLDGDRRKWLADGYPLSDATPAVVATTYTAQPANQRLRAQHVDVLRAIEQPGYLLVDARTPEMFGGADSAGAARGGRIPGAVNLAARHEVTSYGLFAAWRLPTVGQDGTFKSAVKLRTLVESLGITPDKTIITYCVRGGLSTHAWFVLTQLLGYPDVREYDRSWVEWGNAEGLPIESGTG